MHASHMPSLPLHRRATHPLTAAGARCALLLAAVLLVGCSSARPWLNAPLPVAQQAAPERQALLQTIAERDPSMLVAITLSGGGARAAAFGFGVLSAMQETRFHWMGQDRTLLDATDVVSGVSGGRIVAAYFAA